MSSKCNEVHPTGQNGFKLWMVSAWSASNGISLGQVKVDEKSNEITAVPLLIHTLDLDNCIVTIDAMGCQQEITKAIIDEYEHRSLIQGRVTRHTSENTGHGRIEIRVCTVVSYGSIMQKMFKSKLEGLKSIVGIKSERIIVATGECTQVAKYYITSLDNTNPEEIANAIRQHWSIENNLHRQLDVTFREDYSKKVQNAARNFSATTKKALSVLKNDKITKGSINLKRLKPGWHGNYLPRLLKDSAF